MRRSILGVPALALALLLLTACSPDGGEADAGGKFTDADRAQWALPLDPYIESTVDVVVTDYAENLLVSECMSDRALDWPIPAIDVNDLESVTTSPSGRTLLTLEAAQRYGYHSAPMLPAEASTQLQALNSRTLTPAESSALDSCIQDARTVLPLPERTQIGVQLANQALDEAAGTDAVREAAAQWRTCMAPQGISDLPDAPDTDSGGMPTPGQIAAYAIDDPASAAGADEIAAAVADAQCRESSGYDDALYAAEWARQSAALNDNADALVREGEALDAYLTDARAVIAERTGA